MIEMKVCAECAKPLEDILDVFMWDGQPMHRACFKAVGQRCLTAAVGK